MQRIVKRTFWVGGLVLLVAGAAGCSSQKAKVWTFTDDQGSIRNLSDYQGRVVVLNFSNTWCDPCQEAALQMQVLQDRFRDDGVKVMMVSSWERGDPDEYMREHGFNFGVMTHGTKIAREYGVDEIPTFFVVGVDQVGREAPQEGLQAPGSLSVDRRARRLSTRDDGGAARKKGQPRVRDGVVLLLAGGPGLPARDRAGRTAC